MESNPHHRTRRDTLSAGRRAPTGQLLSLAGLLAGATAAHAGFAAGGQGMQTVLQGTVANGGLYLETRATWTNAATPAKPYSVDAGFALPVCDSIPAGRLVATVWGGTANYTCHLSARVNGVELPLANPLVFGGTNDANAVFSATQPSVYGSGSGVWLVGLPVPGELLFRDGSSNRVELTVDTPDSFDGRINQVTLAAVYQAAALNNRLDYVLAEGSGDLYRAPNAAQTDARSVALGAAGGAGATAARLRALYTYADLGQNDRIYFNDVSLAGDDASGWDKAASGLDYGPNLLDLDVTSLLTANNEVRFSVSAADVPDTRESSLRPQFVALEATRPAALVGLSVGLGVILAWPVSADAYLLEARSEVGSGDWTTVTNTPALVNGQNLVILPPDTPRRFYRLRKME